MPLTTYTSGEVLTAASLNANFSFAASNPPGGLELITAQTIGTAVTTVTVSGCFSATYDNYRVIITGGTGSVNDELMALRLGAAATGYYAAYTGNSYNTTASPVADSNGTRFTRAFGIFTDGLFGVCDVFGPNLAKRTFINGGHAFDTAARTYAGYHNSTTQFTDITIIPASGNITGGTIRVYGYKN
jgi:hypothetical protein